MKRLIQRFTNYLNLTDSLSVPAVNSFSAVDESRVLPVSTTVRDQESAKPSKRRSQRRSGASSLEPDYNEPGDYFDNLVKGLHLRIYPSGKKSFMYYYVTRDGTQRRPKLGEYPEITIQEARKRAKVLSREVSLGNDPKGIWNERKDEMRLRIAFQECYQHHWSKLRYITSGHATEVTRLWAAHLEAEFSGMRLSELTPKIIRAWHSGLEDTPTEANRALSVLSKVLEYSRQQEWLKAENPCKLVSYFPSTKRSRYATQDELRDLLKYLKSEIENPNAQFILAVLFTGARPESLLGVSSDDLENGLYRFTGKSGNEETVVFPKICLEIIGTTFRLPARVPNYYWNRIRTKIGCDDLWLRDLRRTFATIGLSSNVSLDVIGELLNHSDPRSTKVYAKLNDEARIEALNKIAQAIERE